MRLANESSNPQHLHGAIIIFLIGSVLRGLAQNMIELIAFRAIQGLAV